MTESRFSAAAVAAPATLAILVGATTYVTQQSTPAEPTSEAADQSSIDVQRDAPHDAVAVALQRAVREQDHQLSTLQRRLDDLRAQTRAVRRGATTSSSIGGGGSTWSAPTTTTPSIPNQPAAVPQTSTTTTHTTTGASGTAVP